MNSTPTSLPRDIIDSLDAIWNGKTADSQESSVLEFKEDPISAAMSQSEGKKIPGNPRAKLIEKLIDESICFANGNAATGHIIVGVKDKTPGKDAFTGTDFDAVEIRQKISNSTSPNLRVDAWPLDYRGIQLLAIHIPEALTLYTRKKGQATKRDGTNCRAMSEEERRLIRRIREDDDYSNRTSSLPVEDLPLDVITELRRLLRSYRQRRGIDAATPSGTHALLREVGLLSDHGILKRAGEILLSPAAPTKVTIRHLWRVMPSSDPQVTEFCSPLLEALPALRRLILERANQEMVRVQFNTGQESAIPRFPAQAIDEAITNAIIHRDWRTEMPIVIDQSPRIMKVWSPGPLVPGVDENRLLTTQSVPRNGRLMATMRSIGLAEESSRGFDRMWLAMLSTGREVPEVIATDEFVEVIFAAGNPDVAFIKAIHELQERFSDEVINNLNTMLVLWKLWHAPLITLKQTAHSTQTSALEARELLNALEGFGVLQQINGSDEWVISATAAKFFGQKSSKTPLVSIQERIEAQLQDGKTVAAAELAEQFGVSRGEITNVLRHLRALGRAQVDPAGPQRGSGTRWVAQH